MGDLEELVQAYTNALEAVDVFQELILNHRENPETKEKIQVSLRDIQKGAHDAYDTLLCLSVLMDDIETTVEMGMLDGMLDSGPCVRCGSHHLPSITCTEHIVTQGESMEER